MLKIDTRTIQQDNDVEFDKQANGIITKIRHKDNTAHKIMTLNLINKQTALSLKIDTTLEHYKASFL